MFLLGAGLKRLLLPLEGRNVERVWKVRGTGGERALAEGFFQAGMGEGTKRPGGIGDWD